MTEYWVSKKSYFCKYCDIYIRDDKPSRAQHENGLRHKGNLERYIREIYKKEDRAQKERADEASQIAKINEAARIAHAESDLPQAGPSSSKRAADDEEEGKADETERSNRLKRAKEDWKGAEDVNNYSDAKSLGLISAEDEEASLAEAEKQARSEEGLIGKWEAVRKLPPVLKPSTVSERPASAPEKMVMKLAAERDPEKAPIRKMFSERKLDTDLDPLEGMEVKVKVDRRSQARLKREAEEAEAEALAASRVIHGSLRPIRLDGLTEDDLIDPAQTDPQPSALPLSSHTEQEDIKPKLEPPETPGLDPATSAQPSVTFKKRRNLKSQPRQKI